MLSFDIFNEPQETSAEALQKLFDICFDTCDMFSLSSYPWIGQDGTMERALTTFMVHRMNTMHWFCQYALEEEHPIHLRIYPLNEQTKNILRTHYRGLFLDDWSKNGQRWRPSLEDLCFFRNGKLLFGTLLHEHMCGAYPEDDEALAQRFRDALPGWEEPGRFPDEQITLPEF